jgi:hypothetical protein
LINYFEWIFQITRFFFYNNRPLWKNIFWIFRSSRTFHSIWWCQKFCSDKYLNKEKEKWMAILYLLTTRRIGAVIYQVKKR